jgi:hypothetical protein
MRRLLAVSLFTLTGCAYVGVGATPNTPLTPRASKPGPVSIRVGKSEPEPIKTPESGKESPTAEASDSPGATQ